MNKEQIMKMYRVLTGNHHMSYAFRHGRPMTQSELIELNRKLEARS